MGRGFMLICHAHQGAYHTPSHNTGHTGHTGHAGHVIMAAENLKKVKILVLGNTGVGKTSLIHLICHREVLSNPSWTVGCNVEVKIHDYGKALSSSTSYFLEFWDVGGSPSHKKGRPVFYQNVNGLILVHDLTNRKSHSHLSKWLAEYYQSNRPSGSSSSSLSGKRLSTTGSLSSYSDSFHERDYDPEQFADQELPILIVGTKLDQTDGSLKQSSSSSSVAGAASINVDCTKVKHFTLDSHQTIELNKFFDKVIERRFFSSSFHTMASSSSTGGSSSERLRPLARRPSSFSNT